MNLQQLEYFVTIGKTKNFTTASNKLLISQPALSKSMSKLEEDIGHKSTYMAWNKNTYKSSIVNEFKDSIINNYKMMVEV